MVSLLLFGVFGEAMYSLSLSLSLADVTGETDFNDSLSDLEDVGTGSQLSSSLSLDGRQSEASITTTDCVAGRYATAAPLSASLFPHCSPYISFASHSEKGPPMPAAVQKVLKWKLTTITPIVIRKVLMNTGFRLLRSECDSRVWIVWIVCVQWTIEQSRYWADVATI